MKIYQQIIEAKTNNQKLLAILLDPDKIELKNIVPLLEKIKQSPATHLFVGGSVVEGSIDELIITLKKEINLPIVLFPGHPSQISTFADGILFLQLTSGRNPDYLIEHQINAALQLHQSSLEIIPTSYILIDGGTETAVQLVSQTKPLPNIPEKVLPTALAGQYLGHKLIYLEAGSGAKNAVDSEVVKTVAEYCDIPIIVGGGIKNIDTFEKYYQAGATLIVIGTAFENDEDFFNTTF